MKFCNFHLTRNSFNLYVRSFFFGLVYIEHVKSNVLNMLKLNTFNSVDRIPFIVIL